MTRRSILQNHFNPSIGFLLTLFCFGFGEAVFAQQQISWTETAYSKRGQNGVKFSFFCPPISPAPSSAGWGTDIYTDDSPICPAGVHAGVLTTAGGTVTIEIRPGQSSYRGSIRNGMTTGDYGQWGGSFAFVSQSGQQPPPPTLPSPPAQPPPTAGKQKITLIAGMPADRTANEPAVLAIDGDITTFTWSTEAYNTISPSALGVGFESALVNRIRLWKSNAGGGGQRSKNLTVEYTTDTGPLASRTWRRVTSLTNGSQGSELLRASAVNADGSITGDVHDSPSGDGWASLTFTPVTATGLRISFANPVFTGLGCVGGVPDRDCNHYRVGEIEVYSSTQASPPSQPRQPRRPKPPREPGGEEE